MLPPLLSCRSNNTQGRELQWLTMATCNGLLAAPPALVLKTGILNIALQLLALSANDPDVCFRARDFGAMLYGLQKLSGEIPEVKALLLALIDVIPHSADEVFNDQVSQPPPLVVTIYSPT